MRISPLLLIVFAAAACGDRSEVEFAFRTSPAPDVTLDLVRLRFSDGGITRTLTSRDFHAPTQFDTPRSARFATRHEGTLSVEVLLARGSDTIGAGSATIPLKRDWRWGVEVFVTNVNPIHQCFGCFGSQSFPAATARGGDSLFIVWGGNSISNPVVY
jgi:hypothetical protein